MNRAYARAEPDIAGGPLFEAGVAQWPGTTIEAAVGVGAVTTSEFERVIVDTLVVPHRPDGESCSQAPDCTVVSA